MAPDTTPTKYSASLRRTMIGDAIRLLEALDVEYVHHGRDLLRDGGLDCNGLVFYAYRYADLSIDHLDVPYSAEDAQRPTRFRTAIDRLLVEFDEVEPQCGLRDGDVAVVRSDGHFGNHLGVFHDGFVWHVCEIGLRHAPWPLIRVHVARAFRHKSIAAQETAA